MSDVSDLKAPNELTKKYACLIGKNLGAVVSELKISQNHLRSVMEQQGYHVNQGNLSKYFSGKTPGPLGLLLELADIVQVSLDRLVDQDFDAKKEAQLIRSQPFEPAQEQKVLQIPLGGDFFVTDPTDPEFRGYLQTYYVYMFSPITAERKTISGQMILSREGSICRAELMFDDVFGGDSPAAIRFTGQVVISKALSMAYVFLSNADTGEIHVLSFRHFAYRPRRHKQLINSRMALLLTNGFGEYHSPSVFRMILTRQKISPEHLSLVTPHLYLNSGNITISRHALTKLSMESDQYKIIADQISKFDTDMAYYWSEDLVKSIAGTCLEDQDVPAFISTIREYANKNRHNKASRQADQILRDLMLSLGYYQD